MKRPIAVAATAAFGADVLERLASATTSHPCSPGRTPPPGAAGGSRRRRAKQTASRLGIPVHQPGRLRSGLDLGADVVVAVAYGLIVPEDVLVERLWLNVHPVLRPRWRGAAPVERALMAGDTESGVTVIKLAKELDAGPMAAQESFALSPEDDAGAVYERAAESRPGSWTRCSRARLLRSASRSARRTYAAKITSDDRRLDLDRPARELVDRVRALSPHIGAAPSSTDAP